MYDGVLKKSKFIDMKLLSSFRFEKILFIDISVPTLLHVHELCLKHNDTQGSKLCIGIVHRCFFVVEMLTFICEKNNTTLNQGMNTHTKV